MFVHRTASDWKVNNIRRTFVFGDNSELTASLAAENVAALVKARRMHVTWNRNRYSGPTTV